MCPICNWQPLKFFHKKECSYFSNHRDCGYCGGKMNINGCELDHDKKCIFRRPNDKEKHS